MESRSGLAGLIGLAAVIAALFFAKRFFPTLAGFLFTALIVVLILMALLVAVVVFFAFSQTGKGKKGPASAGTSVEEILKKGRMNLMEIRTRGMKAKDLQVRRLTEEICAEAEKILKTLREKPDNIPHVRKFLNYYLPTLGSILDKYQKVEASGVPADEMNRQVISYLQDINSVMNRQYNSLFDDDLLDLSAEMEAMTAACKRDGLLEDENSRVESRDRSIRLTL